jgi:hypothetical protein
MADVSNVVEVVSNRAPWNKGKIVGAKPPLRPRLASPHTAFRRYWLPWRSYRRRNL